MLYTVALTGGIGSGKSTIAEAFAALGIDVVDADVVARQIVAPGTPALAEIVKRFGQSILRPDGQLDRRTLREHIFDDSAQTAWLNNLLHPLIRKETERQLNTCHSAWCLWAVPLLLENELQKRANRILVVDIPRKLQLERTMLRDNASRQHVERILAAQATREARLAAADDIIDNSGPPRSVLPRVTELHHRYLTLAAAAVAKQE